MLSTLSIVSALVAIVAAQLASTTVSQSMPPSATAGFNPNNVSNSDACESFRLSNSCFELTAFFHSPLVPCPAQYLPSDLRRSCFDQYLRSGKPTRSSPATLCIGLYEACTSFSKPPHCYEPRLITLSNMWTRPPSPTRASARTGPSRT